MNSMLKKLNEQLVLCLSLSNNTAFDNFDDAFYFDQEVREEIKHILKKVKKLKRHIKE